MTDRFPKPLRDEVWMNEPGHVMIGSDRRRVHTRFRAQAGKRPCLNYFHRLI